MYQIFIVEDEIALSEPLVDYLSAKKYQVTAVSTLQAGRDFLAGTRPDLVILDLNLPDGSGLDLLDEHPAPNAPATLILTGDNNLETAVDAVRRGAFDYLVKPFAFSELQARIEALVRRAEPESPDTVLHVADLEMDLLKREVRRNDEKIDLQPREFRLLKFFRAIWFA